VKLVLALAAGLAALLGLLAARDGSSVSGDGAHAPRHSHPNGACTATVASIKNLDFALRPGAVVCLSGGEYAVPEDRAACGEEVSCLKITASPSSKATLTAAPGAHVVINGPLLLAGSHLTVSQLHVKGLLAVWNPSSNAAYSDDTLEHNEVYQTGDFGMMVSANPDSLSSFITLAYNSIHGTSKTQQGDAIRLQYFSHVSIIGNEEYDIGEGPGCVEGEVDHCHTDTLQTQATSSKGDIPTEGLTIEKNYIHDTAGAQGFPFLKDGDIGNVTIRDNLAVRVNQSVKAIVTGIAADENSHNLVIEKNTYWGSGRGGPGGSFVQSWGEAGSPSVTIRRNVLTEINVKAGAGHPAYAVSQSENIFRFRPYTFRPFKSRIGTPLFRCRPHCGEQHTAAHDDYELKHNRYGAGIDWNPGTQRYGPSH
jgi:hypothetical protein